MENIWRFVSYLLHISLSFSLISPIHQRSNYNMVIMRILQYKVKVDDSSISREFACDIPGTHDDVIKWQHFPRYWPFVRGIHRSRMNSPRKGQWRGALMFSLICTRINGLVNNGEAGDLRRHRAHYDVNVMSRSHQVPMSPPSISQLFCDIHSNNPAGESVIRRPIRVPDSKVHGANMGPIWGRQDPGGPHVGPMNLAIWGIMCHNISCGPICSICQQHHIWLYWLYISMVSVKPITWWYHITELIPCGPESHLAQNIF